MMRKGCEGLGNAFKDMIGNHRLLERLENDLRQHKLSHAYIIEGADGYGKHMLARRIAAALECQQREQEHSPLPCGVCSTCRKILADGAHVQRFRQRR